MASTERIATTTNGADDGPAPGLDAGHTTAPTRDRPGHGRFGSLAQSSLLKALNPSSSRSPSASPVASTSQLPLPSPSTSPRTGFGHATPLHRRSTIPEEDVRGAAEPNDIRVSRKGSRSPTLQLLRRSSNTPSTAGSSSGVPLAPPVGSRRRSTSSLASLKGFFRPSSPESDRTVTSSTNKRRSFIGTVPSPNPAGLSSSLPASITAAPGQPLGLARTRSLTKPFGGRKAKRQSVFGISGGAVDEAGEIRWELEEKQRAMDTLDELVSKVLFQAGTDSCNNPVLVLCPSRLPSPDLLPSPPTPHSNGASTAAVTVEDPWAPFYERLLARFATLTVSTPFVLVILASPLPPLAATGSSTPRQPPSPTLTAPASSSLTPATLPSVKQLLSLFFSLSSKTRKNVTKIVVVHPSFWTRLVMKVFLGVGVVGNLGVGMVVVSAKGRRKILPVKDLSGLAAEVPIQQVNIPPEVYVHDLTLENSIVLSGASLRSSAPAKLFGVPLEVLMSSGSGDGFLRLPAIVKDSIALIRAIGLETPGIFRKPPLSSTLRTLAQAYDRGQTLELADYGKHQAPFLAASLLRMFLGRLPQGMFGQRSVEATRRCGCRIPRGVLEGSPSADAEGDQPRDDDWEAVRWARERFIPAFHADISAPLSPSKPAHAGAIPSAHLLLSSVLNLLYDVSLRRRSTRMDARNLAICIAPVLVRTGDVQLDATMCKLPDVSSESEDGAAGSWTITAVLQLLIERYFEIFDEGDLADLEPVVPLRPDLFALPATSTPPAQPSPSPPPRRSPGPVSKSLEIAAQENEHAQSSPTPSRRRRRSPSTPRSDRERELGAVIAHATFVSPAQEGGPSTTPALHALTSITKDSASSAASAEGDHSDGGGKPRPGGPRLRKESTTTLGSNTNTFRSRRSVGSGISAYGSISRGSMRLSKASAPVSNGGSRRSSIVVEGDGEQADRVKSGGSGVEASAISVMGMFTGKEDVASG